MAGGYASDSDNESEDDD
ncbi:Phosducin domain-containing protein [Caenorhabditis elegans]|nr:Phosducin domain-containing protein [Caenorhabditis elegans]CBY85352.1 Phosducin domain-containing protein [Caenorhabditis elegans]|eukprot:NP_001255735.1 MAternally affected Uncoordination [Caenorhabditis elegans]